MTYRLRIDGQEADFEDGGTDHRGWVHLFRMGTDLNGRKCRVSRHMVPHSMLEHGGKVRTGGHTYERVRKA